MKDLKQDVIKKIKSKDLRPYSRTHFILKNILFWITFVLAVGVGMLAFSAFLFRVFSNDWGIYKHLGRGPVPHFFMTLPYLWIVVMALFALLAVYTFQHTRGWYKHKPIIIVTASIAISIVGGSLLFAVGFGDKIDCKFSQPLPRFMSGHHQEAWSHPELGLLGGEVVKLKDDKVFLLKDFSDQTWTVIFIGPVLNTSVESGLMIKAIGAKTADREFEAVKIKPWHMHPYLKIPGLQSRVWPVK